MKLVIGAFLLFLQKAFTRNPLAYLKDFTMASYNMDYGFVGAQGIQKGLKNLRIPRNSNKGMRGSLGIPIGIPNRE